VNAVDELLAHYGGVPDLQSAEKAVEVFRKVEELLPAVRERATAQFVLRVASSHLPIDKK